MTPVRVFPPALVAACEIALDLNVFYQNEFERVVLQLIGGPDCQPVLIELTKTSERVSSSERFALLKKNEGQAAAAPRGHYIVHCDERRDGTSTYRTFVSDGTGRLATGGQYDYYDRLPDGDSVLLRMVGYEIYLCRDHVEKQRRMSFDIEALRTHRFAPGMDFRNLQLSGETKPFSSSFIEAIDSTTGLVTLQHARRGTAARWRSTIGAAELARCLAERAEVPDVRRRSTDSQTTVQPNLF